MHAKTLFIAAAVGAALVTATPVRAHHSMIVQFALDKPVTLHGVVTGIMWTNPHSWIWVDVKDEEGGVANWRVETGSLGRMVRRGLKKTDFRPGTEVIIAGYLARDSQLKVAGTIVTFPDREKAGREASFTLGR
jgi:hypothetical protein